MMPLMHTPLPPGLGITQWEAMVKWAARENENTPSCWCASMPRRIMQVDVCALVRVCELVCVCVRACERACERACVRANACVCVCACAYGEHVCAWRMCTCGVT